MLIRLMPEQIAANWEFLADNVVEAGPLENVLNDERLNNILNSLLIGDMQAWAEATLEKQGFVIHAIVLTQILNNEVVGIKNLLIYSLVSVGDAFDLDTWQRGLLTLAQFARKNECANILAYSDNPRIIRLAQRFKGDVSKRVIVLPLN